MSRIWVVLVVIALIVGVLLLSRSALRGIFSGRPVQIGQPLGALPLESLDGSGVTVQARPGHVTFINVFATWCPPCKAETPDLAVFAKEAPARGVDVIGVDQDEAPAAVRSFAASYGLRYPMYIDPGRFSKDRLGARIIPHTIVTDESGTVRAIVSGPMTLSEMRRVAAAASLHS